MVGNVGRITALSSLLSILVWSPDKSGPRNVIIREASVARQVKTRTARSRRRPGRSFRYQGKSMSVRAPSTTGQAQQGNRARPAHLGWMALHQIASMVHLPSCFSRSQRLAGESHLLRLFIGSVRVRKQPSCIMPTLPNSRTTKLARLADDTACASSQNGHYGSCICPDVSWSSCSHSPPVRCRSISERVTRRQVEMYDRHWVCAPRISRLVFGIAVSKTPPTFMS